MTERELNFNTETHAMLFIVPITEKVQGGARIHCGKNERLGYFNPKAKRYWPSILVSGVDFVDTNRRTPLIALVLDPQCGRLRAGVIMPGEKELRLTEDGIRSALQSIFSRVPYLQWYSGSLAARGKLSPRVLSAEGAAADFLARAGSEDISPVRFFDPVWFRGRYRVDGVNAFLSYLRDARQRLAWPSAFFAPRWYCRTNNLGPSEHPLIPFL